MLARVRRDQLAVQAMRRRVRTGATAATAAEPQVRKAGCVVGGGILVSRTWQQGTLPASRMRCSSLFAACVTMFFPRATTPADHHNAGGRSHSAPPHHSLLDAPHLGMGAPFAPPMGGARAGGSVPLGNGYNPIDHIFQFHKALRQEIKQLEADATALEHTVMSRMRQQQQLLQHTQQPHAHAPLRPSSSCSLQRGGEEGNSGARGTGSKSGTPQHSGLHHPRPSKAGVQLNLVQQQQQQNGRAGTPPPAPTPARTPTPAMSDAVGSTCSTGPGGAGTDSTGVAYSRGGQLPVVQHLHGRFQFLQVSGRGDCAGRREASRRQNLGGHGIARRGAGAMRPDRRRPLLPRRQGIPQAATDVSAGIVAWQVFQATQLGAPGTP